jgi:hypothetical protein
MASDVLELLAAADATAATAAEAAAIAARDSSFLLVHFPEIIDRHRGPSSPHGVLPVAPDLI